MAYEAFALKPAAVDLVIRAAQGRVLDGGDQLFARLAAASEAGRFVVDLAVGSVYGYISPCRTPSGHGGNTLNSGRE